MSQFVDRVRDAPALANLRQAKELLNELERRDWQHQSTIDGLKRLSAVVRNLVGRLTTADRNLVTQQTLYDLDGPSMDLLNQIRHLEELPTSDEPDFGSAMMFADHLLTLASSLPTLPIRTTPEVIQRVADQFESEMQSKTGLLHEQFDETSSKAVGLRDRIGQLEIRQEALANQFENAVNSKTYEFDTTTNDLVKRAQTQTNDLLQRVQASTERLEREVTSTQEVFRESQRQRSDEFSVSQDQRNAEFRTNLDVTVSEVENYRDQAKTMLEEVAGASTARHYEEARNKQEQSTRIWRIVGVVALIGLVVASGFVFYDAQINQNEFSWSSLVGRSGLLLSLSALATYALKQAGIHRRQAEEISRVANELILLWPFIDRMTEQDRKDILRQLAPLYFRGGLTHNNVEDQVGLIDSVIDRVTRRNNTG